MVASLYLEMSRISYKDGKIYELVNSVDNYVYVGSTCLSLDDRLRTHMRDAGLSRTHAQKAYVHFRRIGLSKVRIRLKQNYPCRNEKELMKREQYWIDKVPAKLLLNSHNPNH